MELGKDFVHAQNMIHKAIGLSLHLLEYVDKSVAIGLPF